MSGSGFESIKNGHGGIYVLFGAVKGTWQPSKGGQSGKNYFTVPDSETKSNGGYAKFVTFPGSDTADSANGGEISSDGNLTVGENARIKAEVKTGTVIIYGKVHGNISVTDRVELKASAEVVGDIKAKTLVIEAGAIFVGKSTVGTPAAGATAPAKAEAKADAAKQDSLAGLNA